MKVNVQDVNFNADKELIGFIEKKVTGLEKYYDKIVDSEMVGVKKPNPIIFEYALKLANISPEEGLMIGDSIEADIIGARQVGMKALHFNVHGEVGHRYCPMISDLSEIKSFL